MILEKFFNVIFFVSILMTSKGLAQSSYQSQIFTLNKIIETDADLNRKSMAVESLQNLCITQDLSFSFDAFETMLNVLKVNDLNKYHDTINSLIKRLINDPYYFNKILKVLSSDNFAKRYGDVYNLSIYPYSVYSIQKLDELQFIKKIEIIDSLNFLYYPSQNSNVFQHTNDYYFSRCSPDTILSYLPLLIREIKSGKKYTDDYSLSFYHKNEALRLSENFAIILASLIPEYSNNYRQWHDVIIRGMFNLRLHRIKFSDSASGVAAENMLFEAFMNNFKSRYFDEALPFFSAFKRHKNQAKAIIDIMKSHVEWYSNYNGSNTGRQAFLNECQTARNAVN